MKQFKQIIQLIVFMLFLLIARSSLAQVESSPGIKSASIKISLLTCEPHNKVYSLYGHTAIRIQNLKTGEDLVANYGVFSFDKPFFILRFVFGLTDYEIGIESFQTFASQYAYYGSKVTEQELNLDANEKLQIIQAINNNLLPNNKVYRYNYFYNNCTTKARDLLMKSIERKIEYPSKEYKEVSYRNIVHKCTKHHPWFRFGNDLLLGYQADLPLTQTQQQFLPENLEKDFSYAKLISNKNRKTPLVLSTTLAVNPATAEKDVQTSISPSICFLILLLITIITTIWGVKKDKSMYFWDLFLLFTSGLTGLILFAMVFSQHPTVNINFQILLLNPLSLIFLYNTISKEKKKQVFYYWKVLIVFIILFLLLGVFQKYAEGMYFLALSLLIRCINNVYCWELKNKTNE